MKHKRINFTFRSIARLYIVFFLVLTELVGTSLPGFPEASQPAAKSTPHAADKAESLTPQQKVAQYVEMYQHWQLAAQPQSFEPVLTRGQEAAEALMNNSEMLGLDTYKTEGQKMIGYMVLSDNVMLVTPDPALMLEAAKKHGTPADIAFFELMGQTLNGYWPITMERLDPFSGCSRFGSHDLVRLYGAWQEFHQKYPGVYEKALRDPNLLLLSDIEDQLQNGVSVCGSPESLNDELQTFIKTYPTADLTPKLQKRLELLRKNKQDVFFYQGVQFNP